jgi:DNA polymerase-1
VVQSSIARYRTRSQQARKEESMTRKRLFLIDGMSHIYRAYYAIRNLSNSKGLPTNAVYGFTMMLRKLIAEQKPDYIAVALDPEGPTERREKFDAYKATRKPMPEDLVVQLPYIRRVCAALRLATITVPGHEADDVIGTLARKAKEHGLTAVLVSSDKDILQLVSDDVFVLDPMKNNLLIDERKVVERMGVMPRQIPDLLGLWGDSSDNIPGAPGIGEKGARELIQTYGTVENCLAHWEQVKKQSYRESLRDNADLIRTSKELATIRQDLPIDLDPEALQLREPDREAAVELFAELGFQTLLQEMVRVEVGARREACWAGAADLRAQMDRWAPGSRVYLGLDFAPGGAPRRNARAACIADESGAFLLLDLRDAAVMESWKRLLAAPWISKIVWDAKPVHLAFAEGVRVPDCRIDDAMLMAFLTAPHVGDYSLRRWALERLHVSLPEQGGEAAGLLEEAARATIAGRLQAEVDALRNLHALLAPQIDAMDLRTVYEQIELPLVPVLAEMELAGIRIRSETLRELSSRMEKELEELTRRIYEQAGTEFNINSPKQLGEVLFEKLNLPTSKKTKKTKGYSTDQAVLEELALSYELPRLILDYRQLAKLKSTYADALPRLVHPETGRLHTSFNQTGTATGRLSSSEPNLQNIPVRTEIGRSIRGAFVPEEGSLLVSADYSQVELRVLAHLSQDPVLLDAFRNDQDVHERTALEVFGREAMSDRAEWRRRAKVINFGIVYGLSAFGLAQRLGIPKEEAQSFIDSYFQRYQGVRAWLDKTIEEARRSGFVRTLFGRIRPIPDINSKDYNVRQFAERTAVNTPIQGTAADIIKIAMIRIRKSLQENHLSSKLLLQVHDELVLECPMAEVETVRQSLRREMEGAAELSIPLRVDMSVADNWKDMK